VPGSQDFAADPRNAHALIYLNGAFVPRAEAKVSIFDGGFVVGDGVWEGLRLHKGVLLFLDAHLSMRISIGSIGERGKLRSISASHRMSLPLLFSRH
jgi:hypothetical protein